jgi:cytochrome P450
MRTKELQRYERLLVEKRQELLTASTRTGAVIPAAGRAATGVELEKRAENFPPTTRKHFDVAYRILFKSLSASDAPKHTRDRQAVMKAFTPRVIAEIREAISQSVERLLDKVEQSRTFDFVKHFAYPLPSLVIFDLLGVPPQFHQTFRDASSAVLKACPTVLRNDLTKLEQIAESIGRADAMIASLILQRRAAPQRDLISLLVHELEGALSDEDIGVLCNLLLVAGHETTANLLGGSVRFLLQKRQLWERLRKAPEMIGSAVEELLRFVSPVLWINRLTVGDIELDGQRIADWKPSAPGNRLGEPRSCRIERKRGDVGDKN